LGITARTNAQISGELLQQQTALRPDAMELLEEATSRLQLSMRGLTRVLRVARTIADLACADDVRRLHLAEALSYRPQNTSRFLEAV
jgi:magnesium chelatase family protein